MFLLTTSKYRLKVLVDQLQIDQAGVGCQGGQHELVVVVRGEDLEGRCIDEIERGRDTKLLHGEPVGSLG